MEWFKGEISDMKENILGIGEYLKEVKPMLAEVIYLLRESQDTWIDLHFNLIIIWTIRDIVFTGNMKYYGSSPICYHIDLHFYLIVVLFNVQQNADNVFIKSRW